jgi:hypothetical protein
MKKIFIIFILLINFKSFSQYQLGVSTGNYAGTNGMYLNPSSIADSRYKVYINLAGLDHNITNDYIKWQSSFPFWTIYTPGLPIPDAWKTKLSDGRINVTSDPNKLRIIGSQSDGNRDFDITGYRNSGDANVRLNGSANFNIQILSTQFDIPKLKATIGFGMRNRVMMDLRNISAITGKFIVAGTNSAYNSSFVNFSNPFPQSLDMRFSVLKETSLTFAKVILNDGQKQLKVGGAFKINGGAFHLGMKMDNAIFQLSSVALAAGGGEAINQITIGKADYASMHITPDANLKAFGASFTNPLKVLNPFSVFDKSQFSGFGFGGDIGVTYELLDPDTDFSSRKFKNIEKTVNKYILKIGVSVNDIGFTKYASADVKNFEKVNADFTTNPSQFEIHKLNKFGVGRNAQPFAENWFSGISGALQANPITTGYRVGLPSNVVVNVDYKLMPNIYIGGILIQNIANLVSKYAQPAPSVFAILPRFETKYFDASLPISLNNQYQNLQVGLGLRMGPLIIGTDHLTSFLNIGKQKGAGFYLGASVPIFYKPIKKDLDGDYGTISLAEQIRIYLRKRHLRKLHRKEMKRG